MSDSVSANSAQGPTIEQRIRWLEQGLGGLSAAIRVYEAAGIDQEHVAAMERAWEAGDEALTKLASENPL